MSNGPLITTAEPAWRRVIVESPYGHEQDHLVARNIAYLRACMRDCVLRHESPYASHGFLTQPGVLRDEVESERALGIEAGFVWRRAADCAVFYTDLGVSRGMELALEACALLQLPYQMRTLGDWQAEYEERRRISRAKNIWCAA